jgi:hypothetical protein
MKYGRNHVRVEGIQAFANKVPAPLPWEDNYEKAKLGMVIL